jgi:hypothetical protein
VTPSVSVESFESLDARERKADQIRRVARTKETTEASDRPPKRVRCYPNDLFWFNLCIVRRRVRLTNGYQFTIVITD